MDNRLRDIYISPESYEDILNWDKDNLTENIEKNNNSYIEERPSDKEKNID